MNKLVNFFFEPRIAFIIFVLFIFGYLILLDEEGAFTENFLRFGPSEDTEYLTMKINSWSKVISVYFVAFLTTFLSTYYNNVSHNFIHDYLWNPAYTDKIPVSKWFTSMIVSIEPILYWILEIMSVFINFTFELQYILPKFLGNLIIQIPYGIYKVNQKAFI
tara:strand:+ start:2310 stop:2795 length:486 start_codon:yes stop_codon:yes gene_type:complete